MAGLCNAMIEAWNLKANPNAAILFVIEDITYNICDQVIVIFTNDVIWSEKDEKFKISIAEIPWILHSRNTSGNQSDSQNSDGTASTGKIGSKQCTFDVSYQNKWEIP